MKRDLFFVSSFQLNQYSIDIDTPTNNAYFFCSIIFIMERSIMVSNVKDIPY